MSASIPLHHGKVAVRGRRGVKGERKTEVREIKRLTCSFLGIEICHSSLLQRTDPSLVVLSLQCIPVNLNLH